MAIWIGDASHQGLIRFSMRVQMILAQMKYTWDGIPEDTVMQGSGTPICGMRPPWKNLTHRR